MADEFYYQHGGQQHGPVTSAELKELAAAGKLLPDDLIWKEGMEKWVPARSAKGLFPPTPSPIPASAPKRGQADENVEGIGPSAGKVVPPARTAKSAGAAEKTLQTEQVEPLPLPDEDDEEPPKTTRDRKIRSSAPPWATNLLDKGKGIWRRTSTPAKFGIVGGAGAIVVLVILVPTVVLVMWLAGGKSSLGGSNEKTASELMRELRTCREQADREFGGKTFTVTGTVSQVVGDSIYLKGTDKEYGSTAYCQFWDWKVGDKAGQDAAVQKLKNIKPGQSVTVKGVFDKMTGGNTFFKNCQLADGPGESVVDLVRRCNGLKQPFDTKYAGKRLRITGGVKRAEKWLDDEWSIEFETDTEDDLTVLCKFKAKYDDRLQKLKKGEQVVMEATFKESAFADFERIKMLDGDLISPSGSGGTSDDTGATKGGSKAGRGRAGSRPDVTVSRAVVQSKLRVGMTPDEVRNILGEPDDEKSNHLDAVFYNGRMVSPAIDVLTFMYLNTPDGMVGIGFKDDKLVVAESENGGVIFGRK